MKVAGRWNYMYRAIDQHGQVIDVLLSARRDLAAARRFFIRALRASTIPAEVTTDRAPPIPRVLDELILWHRIPSNGTRITRSRPIMDRLKARLGRYAAGNAATPHRSSPRARVRPESAPRPL